MTDKHVLYPYGKYRGKPITTLYADKEYYCWVKSTATLMNDLQSKHPRAHKYILRPTVVNAFSTKKAAEEYVRSIIDRIGLCASVRKTPHFEELLAIIRCHPSPAKVMDIVDLQIVQNMLNHGAWEILMVRENGEREDVSWRACITGATASPVQKLKGAMRFAIDPQIKDYREKHSTYTCEECDGACAARGGSHIDHVIHFEHLVTQFLRGVMDIPTEFEDAYDGSHRCDFFPSAAEFRKAWVDYHQQHAVLRVLCAMCNLKRDKWK